MTFTLERVYYPDCTLGQLFQDGRQLCVTIEKAWDDNLPDESCIPESTYTCTAYSSPDHPHVWEVTRVPGRNAILIHNANLASQLLGCIGVGETYGTLLGQRAVLNSVATLEMLRSKLPETFQLTITEKTG